MPTHCGMEHLRQKIKMMSVNQMCVYHTILEAHNVVNNSSSEVIKRKWYHKHENKYLLRSETTNGLNIPERPSKNRIGFAYNGAKLYNKIPNEVKKTLNPNNFKSLVKSWVWENIPAF